MLNKKLLSLVTAGVITLGATVTTFAASTTNGDNPIKTSITTLKENVQSLKSEKGIIKNAMENKKASLGFEKIDKAAIAPQLENLKNLKTSIKSIREDLKIAKENNDTEKITTLKSQLQDKLTQLLQINDVLGPIKTQRNNNKALRQEFKNFKASHENEITQISNLRESNKTLRNDIKSLKEQLKTAKEENNTDSIDTITNSILNKLNELNSNITQLISLKDDMENSINAWQPISQQQ